MVYDVGDTDSDNDSVFEYFNPKAARDKKAQTKNQTKKTALTTNVGIRTVKTQKSLKSVPSQSKAADKSEIQSTSKKSKNPVVNGEDYFTEKEQKDKV